MFYYSNMSLVLYMINKESKIKRISLTIRITWMRKKRKEEKFFLDSMFYSENAYSNFFCIIYSLPNEKIEKKEE